MYWQHICISLINVSPVEHINVYKFIFFFPLESYKIIFSKLSLKRLTTVHLTRNIGHTFLTRESGIFLFFGLREQLFGEILEIICLQLRQAEYVSSFTAPVSVKTESLFLLLTNFNIVNDC